MERKKVGHNLGGSNGEKKTKRYIKICIAATTQVRIKAKCKDCAGTTEERCEIKCSRGSDRRKNNNDGVKTYT